MPSPQYCFSESVMEERGSAGQHRVYIQSENVSIDMRGKWTKSSIASWVAFKHVPSFSPVCVVAWLADDCCCIGDMTYIYGLQLIIRAMTKPIYQKRRWIKDHISEIYMDIIRTPCLNTLRPRQDVRLYGDDIFNVFSSMKIVVFWIQFHRNMFLLVQMTIS